VIQRAVLLLTIFLSAGAGATMGCACSQQPPGACAGLQQGDVVFMGTVTDIEKMPAPPKDADPPQAASNSDAGTAVAPAPASVTPITRYHFQIEERFAGPDTEVDVFSGGDDGDCGYKFEKGEKYIVFTQQETEGRIFATICNGTRPASEGRAILPQLRAMRNGQHVASVFGVLRRTDPPFLAPPDDPADPLPKISLKLRSKDDRFETSTGPNGIYSFYDVHAGTYQFTANLPVKMQLTQKTLTGGLPPFKIPNGACYEYDVDALPTGQIRGSVLGPDGKPLGLASVEIYRAGQYKDSQPGLWSFQGAKGEFQFDHIGPGEYVIVYNRLDRLDPNSPFPRTFYPGTHELEEAMPIRVKDGQQISKIKLTVQGGLPTRTVRVHVKWVADKPAGTVTVMAKAAMGNNPSSRQMGDDLYQFTMLTTDQYTISAWEDLKPRAGNAGANASCSPPARIDADTAQVDGADDSVKEITLTFGAVGCAPQ
jgi:hypothetical protein